jgi:predicted permease
MGWWRRLRGTVTRGHDDVDEEIRFHLSQRIDEHLADGLTETEARRAAHTRFGNVTLARERTREADSLRWLADALQDLRYACVQMRRGPGHALAVIAIIALGIGVNTALFGVVDAVLLRQLPVRSPGELVLFNWLDGRKTMRFGLDGVNTVDEATGRTTSTSFSYPTFVRLREAGQPLVDLFAFAPIEQLNTVDAGRTDVATGQYVSGNYFRGLGVEVSIGRTLTEADDRAGATLVATITDAYWARRFGRDPAVVGRRILVNRTPITIVGVTPPGFAGALEVTQSPDLTLPFAADPVLWGEGSDLRRPAFLWVRLMGRLAGTTTREQAAAALQGVLQRTMLDEWHEALATRRSPAAGDTLRTLADASTLRAEPGGRGLMDSRRRYATPLLVLWASAALVLLVTCLNVANLLLARGVGRQREIATRLAIGAGRWRIVRQLLVESLVLSAIGAAAGLALAVWGRSLLLVWQPWGGTLPTASGLDWRVVAFGTGLAVATSVLVGLVPAWRVTGDRLGLLARRDGAGAPRITRLLMVGQVAVALVLLVAAGLFAGTLRNLQRVDKGFNADGLLLFRVQPQLNGYAGPALSGFYDRAIARIAALPGVRSVAVSRHALLGMSRRSDGVAIEGARNGGAGVLINIVSPGFLDTMEIPLLLGRRFTDRDDGAAVRVAIVNQRFATVHLGGADPIGRRFRLGARADAPAIEIVGVARDAKYTDLRSVTAPTVYLPLSQEPPGQAAFAVRTAGPPLALAPDVREALRAVDPTLPLFDVQSQADQGDESLARETLFARLSVLYGAIALLLVAVGLYGVTSWSVSRRTAEIGVRMALGARRASVVALVAREVASMAGVGVALGLPTAALLSRTASAVIDPLLFGTTALDPAAFIAAAAVLIGVSLAAAVLPARRASAIDPLTALRAE